MVTLALNVAEPFAAGEVGRALFDAVGPLLLIGWSEVGPGLLQALVDVHGAVDQRPDELVADQHELSPGDPVELDPDLMERAREHRARLQRPVSAEVLRKALGVGAKRSRMLTRLVRAERCDGAGLSFVGGCLS